MYSQAGPGENFEEGDSSSSTEEENLIENNIFVTPKNDIQNLQEDKWKY